MLLSTNNSIPCICNYNIYIYINNWDKLLLIVFFDLIGANENEWMVTWYYVSGPHFTARTDSKPILIWRAKFDAGMYFHCSSDCLNPNLFLPLSLFLLFCLPCQLVLTCLPTLLPNNARHKSLSISHRGKKKKSSSLISFHNYDT